eukprot:TRINITY_DN876_c0_g1_i1.p1 TRINITY_DN876_c0_g1~~TRINITY_DN876_c0_g1_i1.p1  ORF type:complete len:505 (+),score=72.96 TRINITY_DN876_c0_g1_i1:307-1821(+)
MRRTRSTNKMAKVEERSPVKEVPMIAQPPNAATQHSITISNTAERPHVHKGLKLFQAIAINVMNMFGTGPFITFPILLATMDGPASLIGYVLATTLAICDGLVWAELGTSLPEAGGTYSYLLEGFGPKKWGRLMAFLFVWQMIISGPLEIASGYVGVAQYFSYFWRNAASAPAIYSSLVAAGVGILNIMIIYRDLSDLNKFTAALFAVTLFTIFFVSATGWSMFDPSIAFEHKTEWKFSSSLLLGMFAAMRVAVYDFTGYFEICYMGSEVENPGRVIPRAVIGSILIVVTLFLSVDFAVIGVVPWKELLPNGTGDGPSQYPIAYFLELAFPSVSTILPNIFVILLALTVYGSSYSMLLGYSRIPFAASVDGNFLPYFDRLHPTKGFPYVSVLVTGMISVAACFLQLDTLISAMITARILVQYIAQIVALTLLRRKNEFQRPFSVWFYPIPNIIAAGLWLALFFSAELNVILGTVVTIILGIIVFIIKSYYRKDWPFLPPQEEIH